MNEPQRHHQIEQMLTSWMDGAAPTQTPTRLLEETFASTLKSRQERVWPWHRVERGDRGLGLRVAPAAVALIVLGLLAAMVFALALAGGPSVPPGPTATPSQPPSIPPSPLAPSPTSGIVLPASISITPEAEVTVPDLLGFELDETELVGLGPGRMVRVDLGTGEITDTVPLGGATDLYNGFATNDAGLWATDSDNATLYHVDPSTFTVAAAIPAGFAPKGILANADGVWVADVHFGTVMRVDPVTNTVVATITVGPTGSSGPNWLASGLGSIWVDIPNTQSIVRFDPQTDAIQAQIPTPVGFTACGGFAIGVDAVWVSGCDASTAVGRFDPTTNLPVTVVDLPGHGGPTLIDDAPWISVDTGDEEHGLLVRIDRATNTIDRVLVPDVPFGGGSGIVVLGEFVWVHDWSHTRLLRFPLAAFRA